MPRPHVAFLLRARQPAARLAHPTRRLKLVLGLIVVGLALPFDTASAAPQLWLPTPPGEPWTIIQGYGCGTHNGWDFYSLDLVSADGATYGAPVRAAADGTIWSWTPRSGTLILDHGDGFYTMYTHMARAEMTDRGRFVARGTVIGAVGDRGSPGTPHLHFTAFSGRGLAAQPRRSLALSFAEGYDLPNIGGCNQHAGTTLVAGTQEGASGPAISFNTSAEPGRWYNVDLRIEFGGAALSGFSQAWDHDPAGDTPAFAQASAGFMQLAWAGEGLHTLYVRAWGADGQQTLATYGPIGYDITPPGAPAPIGTVEAAAGAPLVLRWDAASDAGSGVAGYRIYLGSDPMGTSDWFTDVAQIEAPPLAPGTYLLRIQALDYAGNAGAWTTIGQVVVTE